MTRSRQTPAILSWTPAGRSVVFVLAAASIWCLLAEFYHLCSMRNFVMYAMLPATAMLIGMAAFDRARGDRQLYRAVIIGSIAGLIAAISYDIFRLPFVYSTAWHLNGVVPQMPLFKVFPRFGAMILGQPIEQQHYSLTAQLLGWAYHFSNGITFGVMYFALLGDAARRNWAWGIVFAVGLELAMLYTPYPNLFGIAVTATFVIVTLSAHAIFGIVMGLWSRRAALAWKPAVA